MPEPALGSTQALTAVQAGQRRRFNTRRGWKPATSEKWAKAKRRKGLDPRLMRATGALESALTNADSNTQFRAWNMTLTWGLRWRSQVWYAAPNARAGRRTVVIDTRARREIADLVARYIAGNWTPA